MPCKHQNLISNIQKLYKNPGVFKCMQSQLFHREMGGGIHSSSHPSDPGEYSIETIYKHGRKQHMSRSNTGVCPMTSTLGPYYEYKALCIPTFKHIQMHTHIFMIKGKPPDRTVLMPIQTYRD